MTTQNSLQKFYEFTDDELNPTLGKGIYHLKARETTVDEWDDGRPRLNVNTVVVSGEKKGVFGPRITFSLGESDGVTVDGRAFHVDAQDELRKLRAAVKVMHDGKPDVVIDVNGSEKAALASIAKQIAGDEFIARVNIDKNGYPRAGKLYPMSAPPAAFNGSEKANGFKLDEI